MALAREQFRAPIELSFTQNNRKDGEPVWKSISRLQLVGFWFAAVAVIIAWIIATGVHIAISTAALLLTLCLIPPAILLIIWHGSAPPTVGELLYAVNKPNDSR